MIKLETKRLILRGWDRVDAKDIYDYAKRNNVGPFAGWKPHKSIEDSIEILQTFIEDKEVWAIELKENNKVIGSIGLHKRSPDDRYEKYKQRELGYVLNPDYWNNGYMTEAAKCIINYAFEELMIEVLWCGHFKSNIRSKKVIEKCGFEYEFSKKRKLELLDNKEVTEFYYTINNNDYKKRN